MAKLDPLATYAQLRQITTVDAHTAGEPLRVITSGYPDLPGETILEKRQYARDHHDDLRRALMLEPRGHADMYGCILTDPCTPDGDVGVLFMHNEGYSTMCGHGIIGLMKVGLETGRLDVNAERPVVRIDTPAGRVTATATMDGSRVESVSFLNVPSFLLERDLERDVPGLRPGQASTRVRCDIAFGGAFYAYVQAEPLGLDLAPENQGRLIEAGMAIKRTIMESYEIQHPDGGADLEFLYGTIFVGPASSESVGVHSRNVCIFAEGEVDRSPTGTGVSGRAAIHHARGELTTGTTIAIESILGTSFRVAAHSETTVGNLPAIVPRVEGTAHVTGVHTFLIDPADPLKDGFLLR
jgi:trans-L-3-hydroxyproline dehydratase